MVTHDDIDPERERELKVEGIRIENDRWKLALRSYGATQSVQGSVDDIVRRLVRKLDATRRFATESIRNLLLLHVRHHDCPCAKEVIERVEEERKKDGKGTGDDDILLPGDTEGPPPIP